VVVLFEIDARFFPPLLFRSSALPFLRVEQAQRAQLVDALFRPDLLFAPLFFSRTALLIFLRCPRWTPFSRDCGGAVELLSAGTVFPYSATWHGLNKGTPLERSALPSHIFFFFGETSRALLVANVFVDGDPLRVVFPPAILFFPKTLSGRFPACFPPEIPHHKDSFFPVFIGPFPART